MAELPQSSPLTKLKVQVSISVTIVRYHFLHKVKQTPIFAVNKKPKSNTELIKTIDSSPVYIPSIPSVRTYTLSSAVKNQMIETTGLKKDLVNNNRN